MEKCQETVRYLSKRLNFDEKKDLKNHLPTRESKSLNQPVHFISCITDKINYHLSAEPHQILNPLCAPPQPSLFLPSLSAILVSLHPSILPPSLPLCPQQLPMHYQLQECWMHTLHNLPKDLHICKLTAVNVVDVRGTSREAETQKISDGWKVEGEGLLFLDSRPH